MQDFDPSNLPWKEVFFQERKTKKRQDMQIEEVECFMSLSLFLQTQITHLLF